jgi:hypothetical protein
LSIFPLNGTVGVIASIGLSTLLQSIVFPRGFGADITVEEKHSDILTVTENPVEQGAAITDHAFKRPAELTVRVGYSDSSPASVIGTGLAVMSAASALAAASALSSGGSLSSVLSTTTGLSLVEAATTADYVEAVYNMFLILQSSRVPFGLITGKRIYNTLLITALHTSTTEEWENSMILEVEMREIILVNTQTVSVPPAANMANPQINGATQNLGANNLTPGNGYNAAAAPAPLSQ